MDKLDINILKEDPKEFEEYSNMLIDYEKEGKFSTDQDVVDPNSYDQVDENFPYIRKGFKYAVKHSFFIKAMKLYCKKINKELTNLKIEGKENIKGIKEAIITCNHISKVDSFAVRAAVGMDIMFVAAEFNNWKGPMGEIARHTGYIPLSTKLNLKLMRKFNEAIEYYLKKHKKILIYPEQAMWREYKKPRPLQNGAFHYAVLNNVPIIPLFITIEDKEEKVDENGKMNFGNYTIHILPPIYPQANLTAKQNEKYMNLENYNLWKECYEKTYNKKLTYTTKPEIWNEKFNCYEIETQQTQAQPKKKQTNQVNQLTVEQTDDLSKQ